MVSVSSLWADERVYYPLAVEPYTPAQWFAVGKADPAFRTKPQIALELVDQARARDGRSARWWPIVCTGSTTASRRAHAARRALRRGPANPPTPGGRRWRRSGRCGRWRRRAAGSVRSSRGLGAGGTPLPRWPYHDLVGAGRGSPGRMDRSAGGAWSLPPPIRPPCRSRRPGIWRRRCHWRRPIWPRSSSLYGLRNWVEQQYKQIKQSGLEPVSGALRPGHAAPLGAGAVRLCLLLVGRDPDPARRATSGDRWPRRQPRQRRRGGEKVSGGRDGVPLAPAVALLAAGAAAGAGLVGAGPVPVALLARLERPTRHHPAASPAGLAPPGLPALPL